MSRSRLLSHLGSQDGIRWGDLVLSDGERRRYVHDRLNGTVRLWACARWQPELDDTDNDPVHIAEALAMVREA